MKRKNKRNQTKQSRKVVQISGKEFVLFFDYEIQAAIN